MVAHFPRHELASISCSLRRVCGRNAPTEALFLRPVSDGLEFVERLARAQFREKATALMTGASASDQKDPINWVLFVSEAGAPGGRTCGGGRPQASLASPRNGRPSRRSHARRSHARRSHVAGPSIQQRTPLLFKGEEVMAMTQQRNDPIHGPKAVAARYRARAAARRRHATYRVGEKTRTTLLSVATTYEQIAESVERDVGKGRLPNPTDKA